MTVPEKLAALRAAMEEKGVDGVYVPSADPHMSEYLPGHWRGRRGFRALRALRALCV